MGKIHRPFIPLPYRTEEEIAKSDEVAWEGAWLSFRQRVLGDYTTRVYLRDYLFSMFLGWYFAWLYIQGHKQYRVDMKLFYLEAPEHKINWIKPRGEIPASAPLEAGRIFVSQISSTRSVPV